ncbi:MAG: hypothetical protein AAFX93_16390, partial [Verrucomicrobiota bacterium]
MLIARESDKGALSSNIGVYEAVILKAYTKYIKFAIYSMASAVTVVSGPLGALLIDGVVTLTGNGTMT